jgi:hypothetical protein
MELGMFWIGLKWVFGIVFWCALFAISIIGVIYGIARLIEVIRIRYP